MADEIRIDDLAAPVLNDVQRMALDYGESKATDADRRRRLRGGDRRAPGSTTSARTTSPSGSACGWARWTRTRTRTGLGRLVMFGDSRPLRGQPTADPRPPAAAPRDPRHPDRAAGHRGRPAPLGHHPPGEPARRPTPASGRCRCGRATSRCPTPRRSPAGRRRGRSQMDPLQRQVGGDAGGRAARGGHAPDGTGPHPRGDRAAAAGLLQLQPRMGGPGAAVARLLPRPRPDAALPVHEDRAADPAVVPAPGALGAQVARSTSSSSARCWRRSPTPRSW